MGEACTSDAVMMTHNRSMFFKIVEGNNVAQAPKGCPLRPTNLAWASVAIVFIITHFKIITVWLLTLIIMTMLISQAELLDSKYWKGQSNDVLVCIVVSQVRWYRVFVLAFYGKVSSVHRSEQCFILIRVDTVLYSIDSLRSCSPGW